MTNAPYADITPTEHGLYRVVIVHNGVEYGPSDWGNVYGWQYRSREKAEKKAKKELAKFIENLKFRDQEPIRITEADL